MADGEFIFGMEVRDFVSGCEGIITSKYELINGMVQYGLTLKMTKPDDPLTGRTFDPEQLEEVGPGVSARITQPPLRDIHVKLGQKVEDLTTGMVGIAFEKITFMNGCVYIEVRLPSGKWNKRRGTRPQVAILPVEVLMVVDQKLAIPEATDMPGGAPRHTASVR